MRKCSVLVAAAAALGVGACATVHNLPINQPSADPLAGMASRTAAAAAADQSGQSANDDAVIGLAFSGGGTRAAAFAYGVLDQLAHSPSPDASHGRDLLDRVAIVSGVSGGAVTAAYFGLRGRAAMADFRERFLVQDVMAGLDTNINLFSIGRALGGGANTDSRLRSWFNDNLFHHATFGTLIGRRPIVLINATDIYNRTPFLFGPQSFSAACSDYTKYPIAAAVAASAAVPAVFAPIVIQAFPGQCQAPLPVWVKSAAENSAASPLLQAYARGLEHVRNGKVKYIKLFDGGLIDNYGLSGITILRAAAGTPYGPMLPEEAVNLRRLLFLVIDAGKGPEGDWSKTLEGPAGKELIGAVVDVLVDANAHASYTAFDATMRNWRDAMVKWRCSLKGTEVARLRGGKAGHWNCRDLKIIIGRVSFGELDSARASRLEKVPTSFSLPPETVDELTRAGSDALQANPAFQKFLKEM
jgi:NTE family protein